MPVDRIENIVNVPYLGKSYPPGTTCLIEVNPTSISRTHTLSCPWARKKNQPPGVERVQYMEVFVADVPIDQPRCSNLKCKGGR